MFSPLKRKLATVAFSVAAVAASTLLTGLPVNAATLTPAHGSRSGAVVAPGDGALASNKTDLVVLFQKVETGFNGAVWTYTVANATPNIAHDVYVAKSYKIKQTGVPGMLATPVGENLGNLGPYEVREIKMSCGNTTPQKQCVGTAISAKTSTPEIISTNNSASHSF